LGGAKLKFFVLKSKLFLTGLAGNPIGCDRKTWMLVGLV